MNHFGYSLTGVITVLGKNIREGLGDKYMGTMNPERGWEKALGARSSFCIRQWLEEYKEMYVRFGRQQQRAEA